MKVLIFDVDGTLYSLFKMRVLMCAKIAIHFLFHLKKFKELLAVWLFRRYREESEYKNKSIAETQALVAEKLSMHNAVVKNAIEKWIFEEPLVAVQKSVYRDVIEFIRQEQSDGTKIAIYSDYPAHKKLETLGVKADFVFCSDDENIGELKPSQKAMNYILETIGVSYCETDEVASITAGTATSASVAISDIVYIGDRDSKDGESARLVGIKYIDVKKFRKMILGENTAEVL